MIITYLQKQNKAYSPDWPTFFLKFGKTQEENESVAAWIFIMGDQCLDPTIVSSITVPFCLPSCVKCPSGTLQHPAVIQSFNEVGILEKFKKRKSFKWCTKRCCVCLFWPFGNYGCWSTSNMRNLRHSVTTGVQNNINIPRRISVRGEKSGHNAVLGSTQWSLVIRHGPELNQSQSSSPHRQSTLTVRGSFTSQNK